jgi:hypothetical protein
MRARLDYVGDGSGVWGYEELGGWEVSEDKLSSEIPVSRAASSVSSAATVNPKGRSEWRISLPFE